MVLHAESDAQAGNAIKTGDLVIVYENPNAMSGVRVQAKGAWSNRYDTFKYQDWVGKSYGSKAYGTGGGWVFLLRPTPELWTQVLKHRTQILYLADISLVCTHLELTPGKVVLESGTGSGSLTHSLVRAVAPGGHVHTFEFHQVRADAAREEFKANGIGEHVTTTHRDIELNGFPASLYGKADAVFLDLPGPHKVVESASKCLKPGGRLCTFSPCIEQVQRAINLALEFGFTDITTVECLLRNYQVSTEKLVTDVLSAPRPAGGKRKRNEENEEGGEDPGVRHAVVAAPGMEARGHTGYLTFMRLLLPPTGAASTKLAIPAADQGANGEEDLNGKTDGE